MVASSWSREARPWPGPKRGDQAGTGKQARACPSHQALGGRCQGADGAQVLVGDTAPLMSGAFQSDL